MGAVANEIDVFGEMYFNSCVTPLEATLLVKDQYYTLQGLTEGLKFNMDLDGTNGKWTVKYDGVYFVSGVASLFPSAGALIRFTLFKNEDGQLNICTALSFKNNQDTNTFSGSGFVRLNAGDVLTVRAASDTVPITVDLTNFNVSFMRMGL